MFLNANFEGANSNSNSVYSDAQEVSNCHVFFPQRLPLSKLSFQISHPTNLPLRQEETGDAAPGDLFVE